MIWHPDRFEDGSALHKKATLKTQEINEAYRLLISLSGVATEGLEQTSPQAEESPKEAPTGPAPSQNKKPSCPSRSEILLDDDIFCCRCGVIYVDRCKTSLAGLRCFKCPLCGHQNEFPPTRDYFGCCWLIFLATAASMAFIFSKGEFPIPGLFGVAAFWSLASAYNAKLHVKRALEYHRARKRCP